MENINKLSQGCAVDYGGETDVVDNYELQISDKLRKQYPNLFGGTIHRPDFVFFI